MKQKKCSIAAAAVRVQQEGIGYAVQHDMSGKDIDDRRLAKLWDNAARALNAVEVFFESELGPDWEDTCHQMLDEEG